MKLKDLGSPELKKVLKQIVKTRMVDMAHTAFPAEMEVERKEEEALVEGRW